MASVILASSARKVLVARKKAILPFVGDVRNRLGAGIPFRNRHLWRATWMDTGDRGQTTCVFRGFLSMPRSKLKGKVGFGPASLLRRVGDSDLA